MYQAAYIAATGLRQQQLRLDTIANNVANANTAGYQATRLDFKDALYTAASLGQVGSPQENHNRGYGVVAAANNRLYKQGALQETGNMLDFALEGEGYLEVEDASGRLLYTRGGNFYLSGLDSQAERYLVDSQGRFVRDSQGGRITFPPGAETLSLASDGALTFEGAEGQTPQRLGLFTFTNPNGLEAAGQSCFLATDRSGLKQAAAGTAVRQGALEPSSTDLSEEITRMIRAQRAFSLASRALTTADEMEGIANNLRR